MIGFTSPMLTGVLGLALSRHAKRGTVILLMSLIAIDIFIVGSWFGVEKLAARLEKTTIIKQVAAPGAQALGESVEQRLDPSREALNLIQDYPLLGTGPGSW